MRRVPAWWLLALLAGLAPALSGCTTSGANPKPLPNACDLPACCRNRVFFFLIGDLNPCHDLELLRNQLITAGYIKVYCGKGIHLSDFTSELKKVYHADMLARFVIVGQGGAASTARELAQRAVQAGAAVDLFVYLDEVKDAKAVPAQQVIAIRGDGDRPSGVTGAEDYVLPAAGFQGAAGHPDTLKIFLRHLESVVALVPMPAQGPLPDLAPNPAPTDREGWDFLRPDKNDLDESAGLPFLLAPGAPPPLKDNRVQP